MMDRFEKIGYFLLGLVAILYLLAIFIGMVAIFPYGLVGFLILAGVGVLMIKVIKERMANKEDDYYSKKVDK